MFLAGTLFGASCWVFSVQPHWPTAGKPETWTDPLKVNVLPTSWSPGVDKFGCSNTDPEEVQLPTVPTVKQEVVDDVSDALDVLVAVMVAQYF